MSWKIYSVNFFELILPAHAIPAVMVLGLPLLDARLDSTEAM